MLNKDESHFPTEDEIRKRAYCIFIERNGAPGREADDWLRAETELKLRLASNSSNAQSTDKAPTRPPQATATKARPDVSAAPKINRAGRGRVEPRGSHLFAQVCTALLSLKRRFTSLNEGLNALLKIL
jgi:hypothetical protein